MCVVDWYSDGLLQLEGLKMKDTVTFSTFTDAFRAVRPDNFSYDGLRVLYDYLTDLEEGCGTELELDVIAFCCEFSEEETSYHLDQYEDKEHARDLIVAEFGDMCIIREG
jgi:hypothetical protein